MRNILPVALAAAIGFGGAGCGTIVRGTTEKVTVESIPPGATVTASTGQVCEAAPCQWDVPRKQEFVARFSLAGHHTVDIPVTTKVSGGGAAAMAGNVLIGGAIGMVADASSGASLDHDPNPVVAQMVPLQEQPRTKQRRGRRLRAES